MKFDAGFGGRQAHRRVSRQLHHRQNHGPNSTTCRDQDCNNEAVPDADQRNRLRCTQPLHDGQTEYYSVSPESRS
jgi:hypothetical protein